MRRNSYRDHDLPFGQTMLTLRSKIGMTQTGLADFLGVSRRAIGAWEAGSKYPKAGHLQKFIELALRHQAFPAGSEAEAIRALWQAARQKVLLDERWLAALLTAAPSTTSAQPPQVESAAVRQQPSQAARLGALPFQPTSFIGRDSELQLIGNILSDPNCHLLTMLGPGGTGKTRLALEASARHANTFTDGMAFVGLASVGSPNQMASAIGDALNLSFAGQRDVKLYLLDYLRQQHMLLVLDNFEHLLGGVDLIYDIIEQAPQVTVVITSRERLNLQAEWLFDVEGLAYPTEANNLQNLADLSQYSAIQLFVQRARQVQPGLPILKSSLTTIGRICQHVGGMPLAIELAAAGVRANSIEEIEQQLRLNMNLLSTTMHDMPARHRSMRAVFDHSWNLLSEPERALFSRLAVFRGNCSVEAAIQITGATIPALMALVDKSLLRQEGIRPTATQLSEPPPEPHFLFLEPIREYALEKLRLRGEEEAIQRAHASYYLALAENAMSNWETLTAASAVGQVNNDLNNIRAALRWATDSGALTIALQLAGTLWRFWRTSGYTSEGRAWLDELLIRDIPDSDRAAVSARLTAMHAAAWLASDQHDYARATQLFEQSISLRRTLGDTEADTHLLHNAALQARGVGDYRRATELLEEALARNRALSTGGLGQSLYEMGFSLYGLALLMREQNQFDQAIELFEESYEFHQEIGDRESMAQALLGLGDVARDEGDPARLRDFTQQSLDIYNTFGTQWAIGFALNNLAHAAYLDGDLPEAARLIGECVTLFRSIQNDGGLAEALVTQGRILLDMGDLEAAQAALSETIRLAWVIGPRLLLVAALEALAALTAQTEQVILASQLLSATSALRATMGTPVRPADQLFIEQTLSRLQAKLGENTFNSAWAQGNQIPLERLVGALVDLPLAEASLAALNDKDDVAETAAFASQTHKVDWDDAISVPNFYGREWELSLLKRWVVDEQCQVISLLGLGGIGKSTLAVSLMHQLADQFEIVIWRSLRDIPTCDALMDDLLQTLTLPTGGELPTIFERRLSMLMDFLRRSRILLVLDNLESVLEEGEDAGRLRKGYEGFGHFLRRTAETQHQSSLILTSREKPSDLLAMEGNNAPVRTLRLSRLNLEACQQLLTERGIVGSAADQERLIEAYAGNPLALKIVAQTIVDLFDGQVAPFLDQGEIIFGGIRDLLATQFNRLSPIEQNVMLWLAIMREPSTLDELMAVLATPVPRARLLESIDILNRRSLVERGHKQGTFTLQSVVLEYVTSLLIDEIATAIEQGQTPYLSVYGLAMSHAREYVRKTQERMIGSAVLAKLRSPSTPPEVLENQLLRLLNEFRAYPQTAQGYGPANLITLLRLLRGHLRGLDLSRLTLRSLYMQGVDMQDTNLSGAVMRDSVFNQTFDALSAVAVSSNGAYWAAGSRHGEVRLWTSDGPTLHQMWHAHADMVVDLTFSPDGKQLATTGSWDGTVKLWDVASGALLWSGKHVSQAYSAAFSPDGQLLASTGYNATVYLWDMRSSEPVLVLSHPDAVTAITWSPDGQFVVTGDLKGSIRLWTLHEKEPASTSIILAEHENCVEGLAFSPDGRFLASASWDSTVKIWNIGSRSVWKTLTGHTNRVTCVVWSADGRTIASAGRDQSIFLWDVESASYGGVLSGHVAGIYGITFTPDSQNLLSVSEDGTLRFWDVPSAQALYVMQGYAASLNDVDWSPDSEQVASGGSDAIVTIHNVNQQRAPRILRGHRGIVIGTGWSYDGQWLASSEWNNAVLLWNATTGTVVETLRQSQPSGEYFDSLAWSPNDMRIATGTYTRGIQLFETVASGQGWTGRNFQPPLWIRHVDWRPDGKLVAGGGSDGAIYVWDAADGNLIYRLTGHHSTITDLVWSPDGKRLASGSRGQTNGELFVWDMETGGLLRNFSDHLSMVVFSVSWGVHENIVISGSNDGAVRWWDINSGLNLLTQEAHQGVIQALKRSPDGRKLASCGNDGAIMIWDLDSGDYLQTLRRDRPYERLNISGIKGLTDAQKATLHALGAVEG